MPNTKALSFTLLVSKLWSIIHIFQNYVKSHNQGHLLQINETNGKEAHMSNMTALYLKVKSYG